MKISDVVLCFILVMTAVFDIKNKKIPNILLAIMLCLAIITSKNLLSGLMGVMLIALPMMYFHKSGGIGGGDIKLITVIGLYLGYKGLLIMFFLSLLLCLLYANLKQKRSLPLAPFFCLGFIITKLFWGGFI